MDSIDSQNPLLEEPQVIVEPMSVSDKFIGILSEPATVFDNVRQAGGRVTDWLIPLIGLLVIVMAGTMIKFGNPDFVNDMQKKADQQIQEQVQQGKMTQEQADAARQQMASMGESGAGVQKVFAAVGILIIMPIMIFIIVLIYWVLVRFLGKGNITYSLMLSVMGLTLYFGVIDQILAIILQYATGNYMANLSAGIFMKPDLTSTVYKILMNINPISIWSYYVLGIGFHRVAGISRGAGMGFAFIPWVLWVIVSAMFNLGFMG